MSNVVFPTFPGQNWSVTKTPMWSTRKQETVSGRLFKAAYWSTPRWNFKLSCDFLRAGPQQELQALMGFFNARQGSFDSFLFSDPSDHTVTAQQFAVGDGVTTSFQLVRSLGGILEPVLAVQSTPSIFNNAVLVASGVSTNLNSGVVTFTSAPAMGHLLSWTGQFYFRCGFTQDMMDFDQFMQNLWEAKKIEFMSEKP